MAHHIEEGSSKTFVIDIAYSVSRSWDRPKHVAPPLRNETVADARQLYEKVSNHVTQNKRLTS